MSKRLAFLHTVSGLVSIFSALSDELVPGIDRYHIVDESLLQNTIRADELSKNTVRNLYRYLIAAQDAGADLVMVTCSTLGPAVEICRNMINIPVMRVDEPMAELAVNEGKIIGVAATLKTTLEPTVALINAEAEKQSKQIETISSLCEGAFQAMLSGNTKTHDTIVSSALHELMKTTDVIVLAQASMARVVDTIPEEDRVVPILSSPRLAVEKLAEIFNGE